MRLEIQDLFEFRNSKHKLSYKIFFNFIFYCEEFFFELTVCFPRGVQSTTTLVESSHEIHNLFCRIIRQVSFQTGRECQSTPLLAVHQFLQKNLFKNSKD